MLPREEEEEDSKTGRAFLPLEEEGNERCEDESNGERNREEIKGEKRENVSSTESCVC